jgi:hypothetical protein
MQTILIEIQSNTAFAIIIAICLIAISAGLWHLYKHPYLLADAAVNAVNRIVDPSQPKYSTYPAHYSDLIQDFINYRWDLQTEIKECNDLKEMTRLYWQIEEASVEFKDFVPDQLLVEHINELFAAHARYALALKNKIELDERTKNKQLV